MKRSTLPPYLFIILVLASCSSKQIARQTVSQSGGVNYFAANDNSLESILGEMARDGEIVQARFSNYYQPDQYTKQVFYASQINPDKTFLDENELNINPVTGVNKFYFTERPGMIEFVNRNNIPKTNNYFFYFDDIYYQALYPQGNFFSLYNYLLTYSFIRPWRDPFNPIFSPFFYSPFLGTRPFRNACLGFATGYAGFYHARYYVSDASTYLSSGINAQYRPIKNSSPWQGRQYGDQYYNSKRKKSGSKKPYKGRTTEPANKGSRKLYKFPGNSYYTDGNQQKREKYNDYYYKGEPNHDKQFHNTDRGAMHISTKKRGIYSLNSNRPRKSSFISSSPTYQATQYKARPKLLNNNAGRSSGGGGNSRPSPKQ